MASSPSMVAYRSPSSIPRELVMKAGRGSSFDIARSCEFHGWFHGFCLVPWLPVVSSMSPYGKFNGLQWLVPWFAMAKYMAGSIAL
eukprot:8633013-Pyramimonas_sp.AAC.1